MQEEGFNAAVDKALEGTAAFREMANNLGDGGDLAVVSDKLSEGQTKYEGVPGALAGGGQRSCGDCRLNSNRYQYEGAVAEDSATAFFFCIYESFLYLSVFA